MQSKIFGLSCVWGDAYIKRFLLGTAKTLAFPENKEAMKGVTWNIFTDEEKFQEIDETLAKLLPDTEIRYKDLSLIRDRIDYLHSALVWQIKECVNEKARLLLLPPDSIFGDKTIPNLIKMGKDPGACIFLAHPRVLPSVLDEDFTSNESLVKATWKHLHRSWTDAEEESERQNSFIGGVSWRKLDDNLFAVKHLLPTPYLMDFTDSDLAYFERCYGIGDIDHTWPSKLVGEKRIKFITSSDVGFVAEITEHDKNVPPVARGQDTGSFWKQNPHNIFFDQIAATFRGSP